MNASTTPIRSGARSVTITRVAAFAVIAALTMCIAWLADRWATMRDRRAAARPAADEGQVAMGILGGLVVALAWIAVGRADD